MTTCELTNRAAARTASARRARWLRELVLIAALYAAYSAARLIGHADLSTATAHARELLSLERALHLDVEGPANALLSAWSPLAVLASYWYSTLHYVVTPAVLIWVYRRRRGDYRLARNALVLASAIGLVGFTLLPMAPPRMLPGFVDTLAETSGVGWWGGDASAPRGLGELTNQLAAMPSLHVGWAVWVAWVVTRLATRRWVRLLAIAYPLLTTVVVVGTANHYLLDAVAGALVIAVGVWLATRFSPARPPAQPVPYGGRRPVGVTASQAGPTR